RRRLAQNTCVCVADKEAFRLPFSNLLFPRVWAHNLDLAFLGSHPDPDDVKRHRAQEYSSFQRRSYSSADLLIVAEANSPLQYPTQGVVVRPLKTIIIPGLGLKEETRSNHTVHLKATLGTFDVAATVDRVSVKGEGEKHIILSSPRLSALNRQLQFVTYTNTVFHPKTADTVEFATEGHQSFFTIRVEHGTVPRLYNSGYQKGLSAIGPLLGLPDDKCLKVTVEYFWLSCVFVSTQSTISVLWSPLPPRPFYATINSEISSTASGNIIPLSPSW
uniref:Uncharacterized protein n=1 Tax=Mastacembelus armatus TaxID=205130 RepID=A0A7N8XIJ5_9TELE